MEGFLSPGLRLGWLSGRCWVIEDSLASSGDAGEKPREAAVLSVHITRCAKRQVVLQNISGLNTHFAPGTVKGGPGLLCRKSLGFCSVCFRPLGLEGSTVSTLRMDDS